MDTWYFGLDSLSYRLSFRDLCIKEQQTSFLLLGKVGLEIPKLIKKSKSIDDSTAGDGCLLAFIFLTEDD